MDKLLGNIGNNSIAEMVGDKVGDAVEGMVRNVMSGNKEEGDAAATEGSSDNKGGFNPADVLSLVGGGKKEENEGFNTGDVLSLVGGGKKEDEGGAGLSNVLGLFK